MTILDPTEAVESTKNECVTLFALEDGTKYSGTSISQVDVLGGVVEVPEKGFAQCFHLSKVSLPPSLLHLRSSSFASCPSLVVMDLSSTSLICIETGSFQGCHGLKEVLIPSTCTAIGSRAFANCSSLRSISLPPKMRIIDVELFFGCAKLELVKLPEELCGIERGAFWGTAIKEVTTKRMAFVGDHAFSNCRFLNKVEVEVVIGLGQGCFANCPMLEDVHMSMGLSTDGDISGRIGITSDSIYNSLTTAPPQATIPSLIESASSSISPILSPTSTTTVTFPLRNVPKGSILSDFASPTYKCCSFRIIVSQSSAWFFSPNFTHATLKRFYPSPTLRSRRGRKHSDLFVHIWRLFVLRCKEYWRDIVWIVESRTTRDVTGVVLGFIFDEETMDFFYKGLTE